MLVLSTPALSADSTSFLHPMGAIASAQRQHFFIVLALTLIAVVPVYLGLFYVLRRYNYRGKCSDYDPQWEYNSYLEITMWALPMVITLVIAVQLWRSTQRLDPYQALAPNSLCIEAISLNWKWVFIYPEQKRVSVNVLAIPVGQPVAIYLSSDTVMQSFRIASLAGQIYTMPGMQTQLNLIADQAGVTRGENTQFNGDGFSQQSFTVQAQSPEQWQQWLAQAATGFDEASYADLAQPGTASPAVFQLDADELFARVIGRYHQGRPLLPAEQPGTAAYIAKALPARSASVLTNPPKYGCEKP